MNKALMIITIKVGDRETRDTYDIDDDLPPEQLGENLSDHVEKMWGSGFDPTDMKIKIRFK